MQKIGSSRTCAHVGMLWQHYKLCLVDMVRYDPKCQKQADEELSIRSRAEGAGLNISLLFAPCLVDPI